MPRSHKAETNEHEVKSDTLECPRHHADQRGDGELPGGHQAIRRLVECVQMRNDPPQDWHVFPYRDHPAHQARLEQQNIQQCGGNGDGRDQWHTILKHREAGCREREHCHAIREPLRHDNRRSRDDRCAGRAAYEQRFQHFANFTGRDRHRKAGDEDARGQRRREVSHVGEVQVILPLAEANGVVRARAQENWHGKEPVEVT